MKLIKCSKITVELFGEQREYFAPLNASIEDVMNGLKEINDTAHFVNHEFTETTPEYFEGHKLYNN